MPVIQPPTPRERAEAAVADLRPLMRDDIPPTKIEELIRDLTKRFIDTETCIKLKLRK